VFSKHHLPQLIPGRVRAAIQSLEAQIWQEPVAVRVDATVPSPDQCSLAEARTLARQAVEECSFWGKLFDQRWCRVTLPAATGNNTWLHWIDQGEATLYVGEEPYFGYNVAHRWCRLPADISEVWVQSSCVQSAIWHPAAGGMSARGSFFEKSFVARRDDQTWGAFHDLKCLFDVAMDLRAGESPLETTGQGGAGRKPPIEVSSPEYRILLRRMDDAIDALEVGDVAAMRWLLAEAREELKRGRVHSRCILSGHAHLDLVWLWPERIGELKAVNVFATMNRLMDEYPEFRFAYSQPASYEAVGCREPGLLAQVKARMRDGRWEATGGMYVESDTLLPCGEALARSFLLGQEGFRELTGKPARLVWLPDVFGYAACLPQIMKQTGIAFFFTTKMTWNAITRFPYSSFIWRGNDGSEVLSHVTQDSGYVTHMEVRQLKAPMEANQQADVYPEFLLPVGYGDGGGGPIRPAPSHAPHGWS
jgi:alpha-mannosidase